ncbi:hypothetical protein [Streptomyces sp. NPDC002889]|uniref:hypothetical protein n=1 Tax=Streptomyces sp. NPDC002889 TaxID=3364669 RepID=UPI0036AAE5EE
MEKFRFRDTGVVGEFEVPPLRPRATQALPLADPRLLHLSDDGGSVTAAVHGGVGLWDVGTGALRRWHDDADTACLLDSGRVLLVAEYAQMRLVRYAWPTMTVLDELNHPRPGCGGGIESLVLSPSQ